jgi:hypothetical protein
MEGHEIKEEYVLESSKLLSSSFALFERVAKD